jgi:hypothetical protein
MESKKKKSKGRKNLVKRKELREEAKELVLQNYSPTQIAQHLGIAYATALKYVKYWQLYYTKLALNNTHIAEKQAARIEVLQDEVKLVQQKYWQLYKEIEDKIKKEAEEAEINPGTKRHSYINTRLDILKSVMSRIESEQRLMSLYSPSKVLNNNYVSLEVLKQIITVFQSIIADLVPADKQSYAVQRMKQIDVQALNGKEVIDAEFEEEE